MSQTQSVVRTTEEQESFFFTTGECPEYWLSAVEELLYLPLFLSHHVGICRAAPAGEDTWSDLSFLTLTQINSSFIFLAVEAAEDYTEAANSFVFWWFFFFQREWFQLMPMHSRRVSTVSCSSQFLTLIIAASSGETCLSDARSRSRDCLLTYI